MVAADVLWSDPILAPGLALNDSRGIGLKVRRPPARLGTVLFGGRQCPRLRVQHL